MIRALMKAVAGGAREHAMLGRPINKQFDAKAGLGHGGIDHGRIANDQLSHGGAVAAHIVQRLTRIARHAAGEAELP